MEHHPQSLARPHLALGCSFPHSICLKLARRSISHSAHCSQVQAPFVPPLSTLQAGARSTPPAYPIPNQALVASSHAHLSPERPIFVPPGRLLKHNKSTTFWPASSWQHPPYLLIQSRPPPSDSCQLYHEHVAASSRRCGLCRSRASHRTTTLHPNAIPRVCRAQVALTLACPQRCRKG
jgi:hypothetical protein